MKSIFQIEYPDLIAHQKQELSLLERRKKYMYGQGHTNLDGITRQIACAQRILKLLEKSNRNYQADLFDMNQELNRK